MRLPKCLNKHPTASPTRSYEYPDLAPYLKIFFKTLSITCKEVAKKRLPNISPISPKLLFFVSNSKSTSSSKGHICQALVFASAAATKQQQPATTERCQAATSTGFGRKRHDGAPQFTTAFKRSISPAQKFGYRFYIKFICTLKFISKIIFLVWSLSSFMILVLRDPYQNVSIHSFQETPTSHGSCPEVHRLIFT